LSSNLLSEEKLKIYKTIIVPVVLYGCDTSSLILTEYHRLREFENNVLRRVFEPKMEEMVGGWKKLHGEELHNLYALPDIRVITSRRMRWVGHVAHMGNMRNTNKHLARKKRPLGKLRSIHRKILEWILGK
jgi:hypothetical protein